MRTALAIAAAVTLITSMAVSTPGQTQPLTRGQGQGKPQSLRFTRTAGGLSQPREIKSV